jgi:cytochrome c biogenesis protein
LAKKQGAGLVEKLWGLFASVRLAIVIFSLLALTSIVGTVLEQRAPREKNIQILTELFGPHLAPDLYDILFSLGFMDMYRSWWFLGLLALFALNLTICSLERFPKIWRIARMPIKPLSREAMRAMPIRQELQLRGRAQEHLDALRQALRKVGFNAHEQAEGEGAWQFYAQRGGMSRLGVYITHLSILVILAGAVVGIFFGFKAFVNIPEGMSYPLAFAQRPLSQAQLTERNRILSALESTNGDLYQAAQFFGLTEAELGRRMRRLGLIPFGFLIRCEDFEVDFYGQSDMPKEYRSLLAVIEDGRVVHRQWIEVNVPLKYKGITFYQSSYGLLPDLSGGVALLRVRTREGISQDLSLRLGQEFTIPGTQTKVKIEEFNPALSFDEMGRPFTYSQMMNNPAIRVLVSTPGAEPYSRWVLKRYPQSWRLREGHILQMKDFWGVQYTGLQVRKDPGVWLVYLGCILMSVGLYAAFFMSHRRLWVRVWQDKGSTRIEVAATANKNLQALRRRAERLVALLQEGAR